MNKIGHDLALSSEGDVVGLHLPKCITILVIIFRRFSAFYNHNSLPLVLIQDQRQRRLLPLDRVSQEGAAIQSHIER